MSVGSAGMQAYWAVLCGAITAPLYVGGCLLFRLFQVDDPLEIS